MRGALCAALALVVVVAAVPRTAGAQEEDSSGLSDEEKREQRKAEAKEHFVRGDQLHKEGDYAGAAEAYRKSYAALPLPIMIYNIAQVLRLSGDIDGAIEQYERYLEIEPDGRGAASSRQFLEELRAQKAAAETDAGGDGTSDPDPESGVGETVEPDPMPPVSSDPERDRPIDISGELDSGSKFKTVGLITAGVGVVAIGAAGILAWRAGVAESDLSDFQGEWGSAQADRYKSGERMQRASLIVGIAGVAATAVGAGLYLWGPAGDETRLDVGPTSGGAAATLSGRF